MSFAIATHKLKGQDGTKAPTLAAVGTHLSCQSCTASGTAHPMSSSEEKSDMQRQQKKYKL